MRQSKKKKGDRTTKLRRNNKRGKCPFRVY